jgi:hypothetical protein
MNRDPQLARLYQIREATQSELEAATKAMNEAWTERKELLETQTKLDEECEELYDRYKLSRSRTEWHRSRGEATGPYAR